MYRGFRAGLLAGSGLVVGRGGAHELLQCRLVDRLAFMDVDGTSRVALQTGVEQALRIRERRATGESHLDDTVVALAGADDAVVRPDRDAAPLHFLDGLRVGILDESPDPAERLA